MSLRIRQIRLFAKLVSILGNTRAGAIFIQKVRAYPLLRSGLDNLLGYRRTFSNFSDAQSCASSYIAHGHEHPDEIEAHTRLADVVRESDYPVLFFLAPVVQQLTTVFDLGGNVGNLFYAYNRHLKFTDNLIWKVYDLPGKTGFGERLAAERSEHRVKFVEALAEASGTDLFIASGSLHYFDLSLYKMLATLPKLPTRVMVNRSPLSRGQDLITVQDNGTYLVPCKLHSEQELASGMRELGYELRASWAVHERSLLVPLYPELSSHHYSGQFFELMR